jgi:NCAIR mutase (PurE)-related protein
MNREALLSILDQVASGQVTADRAADSLTHLASEDIDFAHIDHHRSLRKGFPEVIYGEGKTAGQISTILERMIVQEEIVLVTRIDARKAAVVTDRFPEARFHEDARMLVVAPQPPAIKGRGTIAVLSAGTSDIPVAREASLTATYMGNTVETVFDVGVAGLHRLFNHHEVITRATVLIVVAGMEGALPSVVAGLVSRPVIAVPTSVGYGVSLGGLTALFAMLNSCSSNVAVVNIDNGFGAGYMASMINRP